MLGLDQKPVNNTAISFNHFESGSDAMVYDVNVAGKTTVASTVSKSSRPLRRVQPLQMPMHQMHSKQIQVASSSVRTLRRVILTSTSIAATQPCSLCTIFRAGWYCSKNAAGRCAESKPAIVAKRRLYCNGNNGQRNTQTEISNRITLSRPDCKRRGQSRPLFLCLRRTIFWSRLM